MMVTVVISLLKGCVRWLINPLERVCWRLGHIIQEQ